MPTKYITALILATTLLTGCGVEKKTTNPYTAGNADIYTVRENNKPQMVEGIQMPLPISNLKTVCAIGFYTAKNSDDPEVRKVFWDDYNTLEEAVVECIEDARRANGYTCQEMWSDTKYTYQEQIAICRLNPIAEYLVGGV